jgi:hypothetical protein
MEKGERRMNMDEIVPWETVELNLEDSVRLKVEEKAAELNMSPEDLIRIAILDAISQTVDVEKFSKEFQEASEEDTLEMLKHFWIITKDNKPIARCMPISNKE